ncbi:MAG TPA: PTS sugar transporter subunit IIA [Phycisphaerae bacterium]|nr:PTS sugar transporter subunit IIA [Phycisphaerae bacterium]
MTVSEMVRRGAIVPDLSARTKVPALAELLAALLNVGGIAQEELPEAATALLARERLGTTGIGRGIAVPHAKHNAIPGTVAVLGRSTCGIDFASLDGEPVHLLLMILSNRQSSEGHLRALASAARLFGDERLIRAVQQATSAEGMLHVIEEAELAAQAS